jgi:hypothetical protein
MTEKRQGKETGASLFPFAAIFFCTVLAACGSSQSGLKFRAQGPPIDEAFSTLSRAIELDGFETAVHDQDRRSLNTGWRPMKEKEATDEEKKHLDTLSVRIDLRLAPRGSLYDVFLTPTIRTGTRESVPGTGHPLVEKWRRILNTLLKKEVREEG